jgi:hypothetical protein
MDHPLQVRAVISFTRWSDMFGDQVSKMREARTGRVTLLYDVELEAIPGMVDALDACWRERVRPKEAARRYVALVDG